MPAGDEHVRVRQRPVAMLAADLEAALAGLIAKRAAVGQRVEIVDLQADRHCKTSINPDSRRTRNLEVQPLKQNVYPMAV